MEGFMTKFFTMNRKDFIKNTALAGVSFSMFPTADIFAKGKDVPKVKLAIIGVGARGKNHLDLLLRRKDVDLVAICDIDNRVINESKEIISKSGKKMPVIYTGDNYAWQAMLQKEKLDGVIIVTPWEWHKPMIIGALNAGLKYVASEVILGITLQDHWEVVKAAEKNNAHVMMLENVCYRRDVMAVLNMVRQGLFGELLHLQGGYQHDLREVLLNDGIHNIAMESSSGKKAFRKRTGEQNILFTETAIYIQRTVSGRLLNILILIVGTALRHFVLFLRRQGGYIIIL